MASVFPSWDLDGVVVDGHNFRATVTAVTRKGTKIKGVGRAARREAAISAARVALAQNAQAAENQGK